MQTIFMPPSVPEERNSRKLQFRILLAMKECTVEVTPAHGGIQNYSFPLRSSQGTHQLSCLFLFFFFMLCSISSAFKKKKKVCIFLGSVLLYTISRNVTSWLH